MKINHFIAIALLLSVWPLYRLIHKLTKSNDPSTWIIGGVNATDGEFPFIAAHKFFGNNLHSCGGSIIGSKWVLTARHCFTPYKLEFYVNNSYYVVGTNSFEVGGTAHNISRITINPDGHDVAIVELRNEITFDYLTSPVILARSLPPVNSTATAISWGRISENPVLYPEILQKIDLHTISSEKCCELDDPASCEFYDPYRYDTTVCTLDSIGKDTCHADSGGPLIFNGTLVGVVLRGSERCAMGEPAVFASVPFFYPWIHNVTRIV